MPRRPKPSALRILQGNPGHRASNGREPAPTISFPDAPRYLDKRGREEWSALGRELVSCRMLTALDRANLAVYCAAVSRLEKAEVDLRRWEKAVGNPKLIKKEAGRAVFMMNTTAGKRKQAADEVRRLGIEFGMTPSARSKIRINDNQLALPLDLSVIDGGKKMTPLDRARQLAGDF